MFNAADNAPLHAPSDPAPGGLTFAEWEARNPAPTRSPAEEAERARLHAACERPSPDDHGDTPYY